MPAYVVGLYGKVKTGKTELALSAALKPEGFPLVHLDLDVGFERVEHRIRQMGFAVNKVGTGKPLAIELGGAQNGTHIYTKAWAPPINMSSRSAAGTGAIWDSVSNDFVAALECPYIRTIVVDTSTLLWEYCHGAVLEQTDADNRKANKAPRYSLNQMEYREPNQRMKALLNGARNYGKTLILVHHLRDVEEERITERGNVRVKVGETLQGWGRTEGFVDIIVKAEKTTGFPPITPGIPPVKQTLLMRTIETCGLTLDAEGQQLVTGSKLAPAGFWELINLVRVARGEQPL